MGRLHKLMSTTACSTLALLTQTVNTPGQTILAGNSSYSIVWHDAIASGGTATDSSHTLSVAIGALGSSVESQSASFSIEGGVDLRRTPIASSIPLVFGASPRTGSADGGQTIDVFGINLDTPGATASLAIRPLGSQSAISSLQIRGTTPAGRDALQNPLGPVPLSVGVGLESTGVRDAFVYAPGLVERGSPDRLIVDFLGTGPSTVALWIAFQPAFVGPFPPLIGTIGVAPIFTTGAVFANPDHRFDFPAPTTLSGVSAFFQAISLSSFSPLGGGFSNVLQVNL